MVRTKHRWVAFEIVEDGQDPVISPDGEVSFPRNVLNLTEKDIKEAILDAIAVNYGSFGSSNVIFSVHVKWFNTETHVGILQAPRDYMDMVLASAFFINKIKEYACHFEPIDESGTVLGIQTEAIRRDRDIYLEEKSKAEKKGMVYNLNEKIERSAQRINELQTEDEE